MRDMRRDETWLADYMARKAARNDGVTISNTGQVSVSVANLINSPKVLRQVQAARRLEAAQHESTSGRTAAATSLPQSHDAGQPGPLTQSTSGSTERRAERSPGIGSRETNGSVHVAGIPSSARRISDDENADESALPAGANTVVLNRQAGVAPGPLTPIAPCTDAVSDPHTLAHARPLMATHPRQGSSQQRAKAVVSDTGLGPSESATTASSPPNQRAKAETIIRDPSAEASARQSDGVVSSPPNKYHNKKTGKYASRKEARRAAELRLLQDHGHIAHLAEQVSYLLIPRQLAADGSVAERAVKYVCDFSYSQNGQKVVEDVKSPATRTAEYIIKRKLLRFVHGITILET